MHHLDPPVLQAQREVLSVAALNRRARGILESHFPLVWVEGEVSNLARPASGHLYFSLKDAQAQVRCALFRPKVPLLECQPENGLRVVVRARVGLYEGRGEFQLIVEQVSPAGAGALQQAFEALKRKLQQEGLFAEQRKRALPALPKAIGVITSPHGAAVRDVISVLRRRFPSVPVIIYPASVQGAMAPAELIAALQRANQRRDCDVLLLTRGGGSLEDLAAFNDEKLARAIASSHLPIVSAVGHEVDFTIADFVADQRAATPSAAAELLSPDGQALRLNLLALEQRLARQMQQHLRFSAQRLNELRHRLRHPRQHLENLTQRLDGLDIRLRRALERRLQQAHQRHEKLRLRLLAHSPEQRLEPLQARCQYLQQRLMQSWRQQLQQRRLRLAGLARELEAVSPLATLQRGYAIVSTAENGDIVRQPSQVAVGQTVRARLAEGELLCRVEDKSDEASSRPLLLGEKTPKRRGKAS